METYEACVDVELCTQCMEAIMTDDDGGFEDDSDDDDLAELSCGSINSLTCDFYGQNDTCVGNDEYRTYVGEHHPPGPK